MLVKIDSENYLNTQHIVAVSTFTSPDGNVKITIDTKDGSSVDPADDGERHIHPKDGDPIEIEE